VDNPNYRGLILRRTFPQLQEIIDRGHKYYSVMGGKYKSTENRWHFPSGATIKFGHMQHEDDKYSYQGHEYGFIGFDEITQFSKTQYLYLHSRCRSTDPNITPMVRCTSNPGGVGHVWVKERWVTIAEHGQTYRDPYTGFTRAFIPAKLTDNPTLLENDPGYVQRLMLLPEIDRLRLLDGIWDTFEGQAFTELNMDMHSILPGWEPPPEWEVYRVLDWGYSKPFCVFWVAVDYDGRLWFFKEFYGAKDGDVDIGIKWTGTQVAREIHRIEAEEIRAKVRIGPACREIWAKRKDKKGNRGPSISEEMSREGLHWQRADDDRIQGKHQVHHRLKREENVDEKTGEVTQGEPMVYIGQDCKNLWRTLPDIPINPKRPEDTEDKNIEDHAYDCFRYGCMARPLIPKQAVQKDTGSFQWERRRLIKAQTMAKRKGITLTEAYRRI